VLTGGEDHALVATVPPGAVLPDGVVRIGLVRAGAGVRVIGWKPAAQGFDHFSRGR
jgi:thiamine-monophosphate kinase